MTKPTQILSDEHKLILQALECIKKECTILEKTNKIDVEFFTKAIDFIRNYADKFHHAKEEEILFVELCKDSVQMHCNPTGQMLYEHDLGRDFVKAIEQGVQNQKADEVIKNVNSYTSLLQEHIYKEDSILYPMADEALNEETQTDMLTRFKTVEEKFKDINKLSLDFLQKYTDKE